MQRPGCATRWLLVGVAALLLGIVGMHALAMHGATATSAVASATPVLAGHAGPLSESSHSAAADAANPPGAHPIPTGGRHGHALHVMAAVCLAILVVSLCGLVTLAVRRSLRLWAVLPDAFDRPAFPLGRSAYFGNAPPDVLAFSVIRC